MSTALIEGCINRFFQYRRKSLWRLRVRRWREWVHHPRDVDVPAPVGRDVASARPQRPAAARSPGIERSHAGHAACLPSRRGRMSTRRIGLFICIPSPLCHTHCIYGTIHVDLASSRLLVCILYKPHLVVICVPALSPSHLFRPFWGHLAHVLPAPPHPDYRLPLAPRTQEGVPLFWSGLPGVPIAARPSPGPVCRPMYITRLLLPRGSIR